MTGLPLPAGTVKGADARTETGRSWTSWIGFALLGMVTLISVGRVYFLEVQAIGDDVITIRICHWQLEAGYRESLQRTIEAYQERVNGGDGVPPKFGKPVRIIQQPIGARFYGQWVNTRLISRDAPDLIQLGMTRLSREPQYMARFYVALADILDRPNPYNAGTSLDGIAWRETFIDGMQGQYKPEFQDYFAVPTTIFPRRLFYNRELLERATGSSTPPATFGELMAACEKLKQIRLPDGRMLVPISGSNYEMNFEIFGRYAASFTSSFEDALDLDLSGELSEIESYVAFLQGKWNMSSPQVRTYWECMLALTDQWTPGFMSVDRQQAAFLFVQGRAAMYASGAWDFGSLVKQARFPVGVMQFPLPGPGEPFYEQVHGPVSEATLGTELIYALNKLSRHQDVAIDFLHFVTSQEQNARYTAPVSWVPAVIGAEVPAELSGFAVDPVGGHPNANVLHFNKWSKIRTGLNGAMWKFLSRERGYTYEQFASDFETVLRDPVSGPDRQWDLDYAGARVWTRNLERAIGVQTVLEHLSPTATDAADKRNKLILQQARSNDGGVLRYLSRVHRGRDPEEP